MPGKFGKYRPGGQSRDDSNRYIQDMEKQSENLRTFKPGTKVRYKAIRDGETFEGNGTVREPVPYVHELDKGVRPKHFWVILEDKTQLALLPEEMEPID